MHPARKCFAFIFNNTGYNCSNLHKFVRTVAYKSSISLENLYPNSSLRLTTPKQVITFPLNGVHNFQLNNQLKPSTEEKFNGYIPLDQLEITYSKSTGPGGQNVNKINTKVDVRFHLMSAKWIDDDIKAKLANKVRLWQSKDNYIFNCLKYFQFQTKLSKEGFLIFRSDLTRYQHLNLADCLEKIRASIRNSLETEPQQSPETQEKIRKR